MTNKSIGKYGEEKAQKFLTKKGYEILETNFRYSKMAEIDIIASFKNTLHFVEVKTRTQETFGTPFDAITHQKLKSIYLASNYYLSKTDKKYSKIQIDAIGILISKDGNCKIDFIENISL